MTISFRWVVEEIMFKSLYLSSLGYPISWVLNLLAWFVRPFMVYGYYCRGARKFLRHTRISSSVTIVSPHLLSIGDHCWIWHHTIVDASGGVKIGEGVQIGTSVGIFTHSSDVAIRLMGKQYLSKDKSQRIGYINSPVTIGDYAFIGSGSMIMPGANIGKGCVVGAGSVVKGDIPEFSIVTGNPGRIVGSTDFFDRRYINDPVIQECYFDPAHLEFLKQTYGAPKK